MRTSPQPWRHGKTYTKAEMRWAVALVRNAAEQLDQEGYTATITPTENVLADMVEQLLERSQS